jgi:site-specific recombinase XerC
MRDDAVIALMYDTGLRVGELVAVDVEYLRDENTRLFLPAACHPSSKGDALTRFLSVTVAVTAFKSVS